MGGDWRLSCSARQSWGSIGVDRRAIYDGMASHLALALADWGWMLLVISWPEVGFQRVSSGASILHDCMCRTYSE